MKPEDKEILSGVQIIVNRMKEHPEEFFGEGGKWKWLFRETLREVLTETEKGVLHDALKEVRRLELTSMAVATITKNDDYETGSSMEELRKEYKNHQGKILMQGSGRP